MWHGTNVKKKIFHILLNYYKMSTNNIQLQAVN